MKYAIQILALFTIHSSLFTLLAAVPLRWTVETSRAQVAQFEAYRGETLDLAATMQSYGKAFEEPVQPSLYWQTNGMGSAWWTAPATASGNVLRATWIPANDCGGTVYNCFIGGPSATCRAAFRLRMLPSPGFTPNHLPLPAVTYDAALFGEPTINGTNLTEWVRERITAEFDPVFAECVTTNESGFIEGNVNIDGNVSAANFNGNVSWNWVTGKPTTLEGFGLDGDVKTLLATEDIGSISTATTTNSVVGRIAEHSERIASIDDTVNAWQTYWDGDDVRVTVTNYYGQTGMPHLYLEEKMPADDDHDAPWFKTVWDEMTRFGARRPVLAGTGPPDERTKRVTFLPGFEWLFSK